MLRAASFGKSMRRKPAESCRLLGTVTGALGSKPVCLASVNGRTAKAGMKVSCYFALRYVFGILSGFLQVENCSC